MQKVSKNFFIPMSKRTAMVLVPLRLWTSYDRPAHFGSFRLLLTNQTICVLNVVHMTFKIRITHFKGQILAKVLFVVIYIHSTALEEKPQLSSALMLQVIILLEFSVELEHAWREILFVDCLKIFEIEFKFTVELSLLNG